MAKEKNPAADKADTDAATADAATLVDVVLLAAHTHQGKRVAKGETIQVTVAQKARLVKHNKVAR